MAKVTINGDFRFGSAGSETTKVDNSARTKSIDFPREQDLQDVTALGASGSARSFVPGLNSATFKTEHYWDATIHAQIDSLIGNATAVDFTYGPVGTTSGYIKYTGSMWLKSAGFPTVVGETKMISCAWQITGAITRTTY